MEVARNRVVINHSHCKLWLCEICIGVCPAKNLVAKDGRVTDLGNCTACMLCERYCPDMAIWVHKDRNEAAPQASRGK